MPRLGELARIMPGKAEVRHNKIVSIVTDEPGVRLRDIVRQMGLPQNSQDATHVIADDLVKLTRRGWVQRARQDGGYRYYPLSHRLSNPDTSLADKAKHRQPKPSGVVTSFQCRTEGCGRRFERSQGRAMHEIHHREVPACELCGRQIPTVGGLGVHMKWHRTHDVKHDNKVAPEPSLPAKDIYVPDSLEAEVREYFWETEGNDSLHRFMTWRKEHYANDTTETS